MKVKVLSRNPDHYLRETSKDIHKVFRNYDPAVNPFETAREYTRALNATKLDRVFAKPFIASLDGHRDGVFCMCKHRKKLNTVFSGSCDGEVRQWVLTTQRCIRTLQAHEGFVRGITCSSDGQVFITVGDDQTIKHWSTNALDDQCQVPINTLVTNTTHTGVDHHWKDSIYATCGDTVQIWDYNRSDPIKMYRWGSDSINSVHFNPVETSLCISAISDRSISLYDLRAPLPVNKVVMRMRSNRLAWNPMEAFNFTAANEDYNLHTFDIRKLDYAINVHWGHIQAVLDVDYSPTGKEFVSGSYDRTIRIFPVESSSSREIYHTKRMQKIYSVKWSSDNRYILSGSDETNVRLWKAHASEKIGKLSRREETSMKYNQKLIDKFSSHPQIQRIAKHRHVPRAIFKGRKTLFFMRERVQRKEKNRRIFSSRKKPIIPFRQKSILSTETQNDDDDSGDDSDDANDDTNS